MRTPRNLKHFIAGAFAASGLAALAAVDLPHTFTAGTTIRASEVNANFAALETAVNAMSPAAGGFARLTTAAQTPQNTTPTTLRQFTVNAPGAGTLLVTVTGQYLFTSNAPSTTSLSVTGALALCENANTLTAVSCADTQFERTFQDPDNNPDVNATRQYAFTRAVTVLAAGNKTFYLNGAGGGTGNSLALWRDTQVTAVFVPNGLSITTSP